MSKAVTAGASLLQLLNQFGDQGARPRPLPERAQACFVDVDDHHRPLVGGGDARLQHLIEVEIAKPQVLQGRRVPDPQRDEARQHQKAYGAAKAEPMQDAELGAERALLLALGFALFLDFVPPLIEAARIAA